MPKHYAVVTYVFIILLAEKVIQHVATVPAFVWDFGGLRADFAVDYTLLIGANIVLAAIYGVAVWHGHYAYLRSLTAVPPASLILSPSMCFTGCLPPHGLSHRSSGQCAFSTSKIYYRIRKRGWRTRTPIVPLP